MSQRVSLNQLWESTPPSEQIFQPDQLVGYPDVVQRYLNHAIALETPLASAVRLRMQGEIKLRGGFPSPPNKSSRGVEGLSGGRRYG